MDTKRVFVFDSESGFEEKLQAYISAHHEWRHVHDTQDPNEPARLEILEKTAMELAEFCMFHLTVVPYLNTKDVLVLRDLKESMNKIRLTLEKL